MSLASLEAALFAAVTVRASSSLLQDISESRSIGAQQRLDAYLANVSGAHLNALQHAYPVTREVLGPRYWQRLLEEEIKRFASTVADLNAYGEFMPGVLRAAQARRAELENLPYLADLASLEWYVHSARGMRDDLTFDWQTFAALTPAQQSLAVFVPSHALTVFRSDYPIDVIWHAHQSVPQQQPEGGARVACCIHRTARFDVTVTRLAPDSADLLAAIGTGASLETLSAMAQGKPPAAMIHQLYAWIQRDWIVGFELK